jgi:antitoxin (DNA-binding transcriptional repressor) of toxin-antitoxin stability system
METLTVSDFRNNLAESFNRVSNGENVLIRRKK